MMTTRDKKKKNELIKAILALRNSDEAGRFLRDLLTAPELNEFGNRWLAARMLSAKISYSAIRGKTGLSSATIARISKWLNRGKGGYRLVIGRLTKQHHRNSFSLNHKGTGHAFGKGLG